MKPVPPPGRVPAKWRPPLGLVVAAIPATIAEVRFANKAFRLRNWRSPDGRRLNYLEYILANDEHAKEMKLFGLGPLFLGRYKELAERFHREDSRLAVRRAANAGISTFVVGIDISEVTSSAAQDGNPDDTDNCVSGCHKWSCGDGFVHAVFETCDDANTDNTDACVDDGGKCVDASCGDGYLFAGDRGGAIHGRHIDVFLVDDGFEPLEDLFASTDKRTFEAHIVAPEDPMAVAVKASQSDSCDPVDK